MAITQADTVRLNRETSGTLYSCDPIHPIGRKATQATANLSDHTLKVIH